MTSQQLPEKCRSCWGWLEAVAIFGLSNNEACFCQPSCTSNRRNLISLKWRPGASQVLMLCIGSHQKHFPKCLLTPCKFVEVTSSLTCNRSHTHARAKTFWISKMLGFSCSKTSLTLGFMQLVFKHILWVAVYSCTSGKSKIKIQTQDTS